MRDMLDIKRMVNASGKREMLRKRLGVSGAEMSRILNGKRRIRVDQLEAMADVLGVHPVELLDEHFLMKLAKKLMASNHQCCA